MNSIFDIAQEQTILNQPAAQIVPPMSEPTAFITGKESNMEKKPPCGCHSAQEMEERIENFTRRANLILTVLMIIAVLMVIFSKLKKSA